MPGFNEQPHGHGLVERLAHLVLGQVQDLAEQLDIDLRAQRRRDRKHVGHPRRQRPQPVADDVADTDRHPPHRRVDFGSRVGQGPRQLADEERVATRVPPQPLREAGVHRRQEVTDQVGDIGLADRPERQAYGLVQRRQLTHQVEQRRVAATGWVAVADDEQEAARQTFHQGIQQT